MQRINNNRNLIFLGLAILALYAHLVIGKQIANGLLYVWYIILVLSILTILLLSLYAIRVLITRWQIQVAEAQIAIAKATREKRHIVSFPQGEQVFQLGIDGGEANHALHLIPQSHFNGMPEPATDQEMLIFTQYNTTFNQQNNEYHYGPEPEIADNPIPLLESGSAWLDDLIETSPHLHICGPTQSGKTTLGKYVIERMNQDNTDFYLIDPKMISLWPVEPMANRIRDVVDALQKLMTMLEERIESKIYDRKVLIIIDEWDWIYKHHKSNALDLLIELIKVGAALNYKVLLIGQSPLSKDTGLSGSDFHNMARIALWAEGEKLINSLPIQLKDKAPLKEQIRQLKTSSNNIRYGVVVPMNSQPEVKIIPNLVTNDQLLIDAPKMEEGPIDEIELEVIEILENGGSLREAARFLTGKEQRLINGSDVNKVKAIVAKHDIDL